MKTGIANLDNIVGGGLREGSTTLLAGPSGSGKTILVMHFLSAASKEEPALYFGFYENPAVLALKAHRLELGFEKLQRESCFHCLWQPPTEDVLDAVGPRLLDAVRSTGARRVFVDGLDGFIKTAVQAERMSHYLTALTNELRALGATAVYTLEVPNLIGADFRLPLAGVSTIVENLIILRFVEVRTQLFRMLSVLKMRDSEHQTSLYEFAIERGGVSLNPTSESAERILAGLAIHGAHPRPPLEGLP
jgi:circadian clock protein KaiC